MAESLGLTSESYNYENLIAGDFPVITRPIILISGQDLDKGTLIGRITKAAGAAVAGTNTGNGAPGTLTAGNNIKLGVYTLTCCNTDASGSEIFNVFDPDGVRLEDLTIAVAYSNNHFGITIADGDSDFIVGDTFTVTVAAGSGKYTQALAVSVDGSQLYENMCLLGEDGDASLGDLTTIGWYTGEYNENKVTFGAGLTFASSKYELSKYGLHLKAACQQS